MKTAPTSEKSIAQPYNSKSLEKKGKNKQSLREELGWPNEPKRPIVCLPAGMTDALGGQLLEEAIEGILSLPVEILILGKGSEKYGKLFTELSSKHGHRIHIIPNKEGGIAKMLAASDIALFFSDPTDLPELGQCLDYGVVPISPRAKNESVIQDYNPVSETGNSFLYEDPSSWHFFAALVRAVETHRFPFDWRTIQKHCMES